MSSETHMDEDELDEDKDQIIRELRRDLRLAEARIEQLTAMVNVLLEERLPPQD